MTEIFNQAQYRITYEQTTGTGGEKTVNGQEIKGGPYYFKFILWKEEMVNKVYRVNLKSTEVTADVSDGVIEIFKKYIL